MNIISQYSHLFREQEEAQKLSETASSVVEKATIRLERIDGSPRRITSVDDEPEMSDISSDEEEEETTKEPEPVVESSVTETSVPLEDPPVEEEPSTIELIKKEIHENNEKQKTSEKKPEAIVKYSSEEEIPSDSESQPDEKVAAEKLTKLCEPVKLEPIVLQKSRINGASNRHEPTVRFRPTFSPEREEVIKKQESEKIKKETSSQVDQRVKIQELTIF